MHKDETMRRASRTLTKVAGAGTALAIAFAPTALAGEGNGTTPPGQAKKEAAPAPAPPPHAPAHGVRGTAPQSAAKAKKPKQAGPSTAPAAAAPKPKPAARAPQQAKQQQPTPARGNSAIAHERVTFCHATGSATNPFVEITTSRSAVIHAHDHHQDGRDIIPVPAGGCPGQPEQAPAAVTERSGARATPVVPVAPALPGVPSVERHASVLTAPAETVPAPIALTHELVPTGDAHGVLGAAASSAPEDEAAEVAPRGEVAAVDNEGRLPFTGLELLVVVAGGIAALLAGFALHRASQARS